MTPAGKGEKVSGPTGEAEEVVFYDSENNPRLSPRGKQVSVAEWNQRLPCLNNKVCKKALNKNINYS